MIRLFLLGLALAGAYLAYEAWTFPSTEQRIANAWTQFAAATEKNDHKEAARLAVDFATAHWLSPSERQKLFVQAANSLVLANEKAAALRLMTAILRDAPIGSPDLMRLSTDAMALSIEQNDPWRGSVAMVFLIESGLREYSASEPDAQSIASAVRPAAMHHCAAVAPRDTCLTKLPDHTQGLLAYRDFLNGTFGPALNEKTAPEPADRLPAQNDLPPKPLWEYLLDGVRNLLRGLLSLQFELAPPTEVTMPAPVEMPRIQELPKPSSVFTLFYATNRAPNEGSFDPYRRYRSYTQQPSAYSPLEYGTVRVSIPPIHKEGQIESAQDWVVTEVRPDSSKHIALSQAKTMPANEFFSQMRDQIGRTSRKEAFVFIHGFNVSFAQAAERTAQMSFDLRIDGASAFYAWPTIPSVLSYVPDTYPIAPKSIADLRTFLSRVGTDTGAERVYVLTHSMGNRFVLKALEQMTAAPPGAATRPLITEAVFAAPDVVTGNFSTVLAKVRPILGRATLYANGRDVAMRASWIANGAPRAGDAKTMPVLAEKFDGVDATGIWTNDESLEHSYFGDGMLDDLKAIFWRSVPPAKRCGLASVTPGRWRFSAQTCSEAVNRAFRTALRLIRDFGPQSARAKGLELYGSKPEWPAINAVLSTLLTP